MTQRTSMLSEIRYAERLCQRTARFYRHVQTISTFLSVVGGSALLSALAQSVPNWVAITGAGLFTTFGALMIAVRPADKAAQNEIDMRRYAALRAKANGLTDDQLRLTIDEARPADAPEIEAMRDVAYNDVAIELGQPSYQVPLRMSQRILAAIA